MKEKEAVLISIQPKWCELIASGKKTVEVRKTAPKLETPFKCYIYKTKKRILRDITHKGELDWVGQMADKTKIISCPDFDGGKVIGEFVCDRVSKYPFDWATFTAYGTELFTIKENELKLTCLSRDEFNRYGADNYKHKGYLYGWHISDLKIYDQPKELGEFRRPKCKQEENGCSSCSHLTNFGCDKDKVLTCPPQSLRYVET